ncbi:MAG: glycosyltransferase family 39 protein [Armatimonadota bacterium]|jgi:hypothetical protein
MSETLSRTPSRRRFLKDGGRLAAALAPAPRQPPPWLGRLVVPALMLICFGLRYYATTTVPMPWEEAGTVSEARRISLAPGATYLPYHGARHLGGQYYLAKLGSLLLGHNIVGFRFMSVVLGTASCWVLFALVRRVWGMWPAAFSLFLLTFNGFHIGVSRFAIERTYLFFSVLAIYLFWRAVREDRPWFMIAAGAVVGAGAIVAKHTFVLFPAFAIYLALHKRDRRWLARWQPYVGVLVAVAICLPLVCLSLSNAGGQPSALQQDFADHADRLGHFALGWGPLALYIAPLYYKLSARISMYPVMSLASGVLLLGAVVHGHFAARERFTKLLLVIFWVFFAGFSIFVSDRPEFKWTATSLFAAVPLAGRMLWGVWTQRTVYGIASCLPLLYIAGFAVWMVNMSHNTYYSPLIPPRPQQMHRAQATHGALTGAALYYDFPSLVGSPFFPARYRTYYLQRYLMVARLVDEGVMNPVLKRPVLAQAARIDPEHPELWRLLSALEGAGPAGEELPAGVLPLEEVFLCPECGPYGTGHVTDERDLLVLEWTWPKQPREPPEPETGAR